MSKKVPRELMFRPFAGHGAVWFIAEGYRKLVRVDPASLKASTLCTLAGPSRSMGSPFVSQLVFTSQWMWWPDPAGGVVQIDPRTGDQRRIDSEFAHPWTLDGMTTEWAANDSHVYATAWPSGELMKIDQSAPDRQVICEVGAHLRGLATKDDAVFVVDRNDESLLCLDAGSLVRRWRARVGGTIEHLVPTDRGLMVLHRDDVAGGFPPATQVSVFDAEGGRHPVGLSLRQPALGPSVVYQDGVLWAGSGWGRRGTWQGVRLDDPQAPVIELRAKAQADWIVFLPSQVWTSGFSVKKQRSVLDVYDVDTWRRRRVSLSGVDWGAPYWDDGSEEHGESRSPVDREAALREIREAITAPLIATDERTGEKSEYLDEWQQKMSIVDLRNNGDHVELLFHWSDEPEPLFGWCFPWDSEEDVGSFASDIWLELMEELDTGAMHWADRTLEDGITWLDVAAPQQRDWDRRKAKKRKHRKAKRKGKGQK